MIKIIEPGTRTVTNCEYCCCKFSYEKEDIKKDGLFANDVAFFWENLGCMSAVR